MFLGCQEVSKLNKSGVYIYPAIWREPADNPNLLATLNDKSIAIRGLSKEQIAIFRPVLVPIQREDGFYEIMYYKKKKKYYIGGEVIKIYGETAEEIYEKCQKLKKAVSRKKYGDLIYQKAEYEEILWDWMEDHSPDNERFWEIPKYTEKDFFADSNKED